jgi:hypothetical protein
MQGRGFNWPYCIEFYSTVEGELGVAIFIDNFFKPAPLPDACGSAPPCLGVPQGTVAGIK